VHSLKFKIPVKCDFIIFYDKLKHIMRVKSARRDAVVEYLATQRVFLFTRSFTLNHASHR